MNKEKQYAKNTVILLIGKFSTQIISFLLLPLYTYKLTTDNYGYIDLIQTYVSLLAPIVLLQLDSAVFRYLIDVRDNKEEKKKVISSSFMCIIVVLIISSLVFFTINYFIEIRYYKYIAINMLAIVLNTYSMSIARGNGHNKVYAISSIISSIVTLLVNMILIIGLGFDAKSILIAAIVSNIISFFFVLKKESIYELISISYFDKNVLKKLLKYSIPMIPNVLSWWVVGLSDRTLIVYYIGTAANGIYSVSCKFSNLLNGIFSIFNMSWQETASLHINDKDSSEFFSKMIINVFNLFVIISCVIIAILPFVFDIVIGNDYSESYKYIPIMLSANLGSVLVGLFGGIYVAKKMTKKVASTTICSAIINIIVNILFIKKIGLYAACLSTLIAYFVMLVYRYYDIKKIINIKIDINKYIFYISCYIVLLVTYYIYKPIIGLIIIVIVIIFYLKENKDFIKEIIKALKKKRNINKI